VLADLLIVSCGISTGRLATQRVSVLPDAQLLPGAVETRVLVSSRC
jgi:hypothetical protein